MILFIPAQCASAEIKTLVELMGKVESEVIPALLKEEPGAHSCWTCLQDCLHAARLIFTNRLIEHPGIKVKNKHVTIFCFKHLHTPPHCSDQHIVFFVLT